MFVAYAAKLKGKLTWTMSVCFPYYTSSTESTALLLRIITRVEVPINALYGTDFLEIDK